MLRENGEVLLKKFAESAYPETVTKVTDGVYHVMGVGHSNAIFIEGDNSVILIDTLDTNMRAEKLKKLINEKTNKPIKTIIYTHGHPDHRGGAAVFRNTVEEIIAFVPKKPILGRMRELGEVLNKRTAFQFGYNLTDEEVITQGIGIREGFTVNEGMYDIVPATTLYTEDKVSRIIDGIKVELVAAIGETDDQIFVWLPEKKVLCCGDNYYGCWPNLYALRGSQYRDVCAWVETLDVILSYPAEYVLPGHTRPLMGRETVQKVLTNFRNAIDYVLTQTLKGMNEGLSADELASCIRLPEEYANLPYLGEFYGTVAWSVRSIYSGYLGWFDGNPTNLNKLPPKEHAESMLDLIGGEEKLLQEIEIALDTQRFQWAIELCDLLIVSGKADNQGKELKVRGLLELSRMETSANGRHFYIASAKDLREEK